MFDPLLFGTAVGAIGIAALALRLLLLLAPRVRRTHLWMPLLTLFLASAALNVLVAVVATVAQYGDEALAGGLSRGVSVCVLLGEASLVQLLLSAPVVAPGRLPALLVVVLYTIAFGFAVVAPSGIFLQSIESAGGFPYAKRTPAFWALEGAMVLGMMGGLAWQLRTWRKAAGAKRDAARSLFFAATLPIVLYAVAPLAGATVESGQTSGVIVGTFVVGIYLALRSGHLPLPIPATLQGVLNATQSPALVVDREGLVVRCNRAATEAFGSQAEAVGKPFEVFLQAGFPSGAAMGVAAAHIGDVLVGKAPRFEGPVGDAGRPSRPYRMIVDPLMTEPGSATPGAAFVQFIDETQRRDAELAATRLRDLQDLVIRVMGHDLKAPIAVMQGNLEIAKMDVGGSSLGAAAKQGLVTRLDKANQAAAGMQVILANARAISRLEMAPGSAPRAEPLDLAKIVKETVDLLRPLADAKAQSLTVEAPDVMRVVLPPGFESVVSNLVSNAVKYTPDKGRVEVALAREGRSTVFTVADSGPGIPAEKRALLFRKFERLALEQSVASHGLGLSIASSIVELAGGTIAALDRPDGARGTMFRVELPATAPAP